MLLLFTFFGAFILCQFYLTALYSSLAVPATQKPLDTFEDLLRASQPLSKYRFYVQTSSYILQLFQRASPTDSPLYYAIGQKFNSTVNSRFSHQEDVARLLDDSEYNVLFTDRLSTEAFSVAHMRAAIHFGRENFDNTQVGIAARKSSPLVEPFNVV